ncbi:MAG: hypothetical protein F2929_03200 [Actinobacteria bacterium]|nr:hypothetical protein [Actinomycetota bacterium]
MYRNSRRFKGINTRACNLYSSNPRVERSAMSERLIHPFTFGDMSQKDLLGGKGANLAEMVRIGLPVPPGFTITTPASSI